MRVRLFVSSVLVVLCCFSSTVRAQDAVVPDAALKKARAFVDDLIAAKYVFVAGTFDSTMAHTVTLEKLKSTWENILEKVGAFHSVKNVRSEVQAPYYSVFVTCEFENGDYDVKVVYNRALEVAGMFVMPARSADMWKVPEYVIEDSLREKPVSFGVKPYILHGALTVPRNGAHLPVVVLVHGSGPQDRDETIGPNKPFKDLAFGLATLGVATLRYEKRTLEHASRMYAVKDQITVNDETVDDVLLAVKMLRGRDEIDPHRIFVLGHSLGGYLIPRIAARDTGIAGFISLAGSARPLEDAILEQMEYLLLRDSASSDSVRTLLERIRSQCAQVKDRSLNAATPTSFLPLSVPASYWLDLRGYDPAAKAVAITKPMLFLQGGRDYQVTKSDFDIWKHALGTRKDVKFNWYPDLNHLFATGVGKALPEEYELPGHVAGKVIADIAAWVRHGGHH